MNIRRAGAAVIAVGALTLAGCGSTDPAPRTPAASAGPTTSAATVRSTPGDGSGSRVSGPSTSAGSRPTPSASARTSAGPSRSTAGTARTRTPATSTSRDRADAVVDCAAVVALADRWVTRIWNVAIERPVSRAEVDAVFDRDLTEHMPARYRAAYRELQAFSHTFVGVDPDRMHTFYAQAKAWDKRFTQMRDAECD